jgi:hypothetical protein
MKVYDVRWDDDEYFYTIGTFANQDHAQAVVDRFQPFIDAEIVWGNLDIHEVTVCEKAWDLSTIEDLLEILGDQPFAEDRASEMRISWEAVKSAPEDYPEATLALWGVEPVKPSKVFGAGSPFGGKP